MTDKEKAIRWFENIADECAKLTSGNVAHLKAQIKGMAIRSAEYLKKHSQEPASEELRTKQVATIKCEKKSPITGGEMRLLQEKSSVKFRGEEVSFVKKFYHCVDSGRDFTDTELDNDNMWAIFRAYCEKMGMKSFKDIILRDDTQEG